MQSHSNKNLDKAYYKTNKTAQKIYGVHLRFRKLCLNIHEVLYIKIYWHEQVDKCLEQ